MSIGWWWFHDLIQGARGQKTRKGRGGKKGTEGRKEEMASARRERVRGEKTGATGSKGKSNRLLRLTNVTLLSFAGKGKRKRALTSHESRISRKDPWWSGRTIVYLARKKGQPALSLSLSLSLLIQVAEPFVQSARWSTRREEVEELSSSISLPPFWPFSVSSRWLSLLCAPSVKFSRWNLLIHPGFLDHNRPPDGCLPPFSRSTNVFNDTPRPTLQSSPFLDQKMFLPVVDSYYEVYEKKGEEKELVASSLVSLGQFSFHSLREQHVLSLTRQCFSNKM